MRQGGEKTAKRQRKEAKVDAKWGKGGRTSRYVRDSWTSGVARGSSVALVDFPVSARLSLARMNVRWQQCLLFNSVRLRCLPWLLP